jgi:serine/threonine protein kinase
MPFKNPHRGVQTAPMRRWVRIKALKENQGGFNGGIYEVEDRDAPGKTYIEKVATRQFVENELIYREIVILKHLSRPTHAHITEMVDHYVNRRRGKASIYLELCTEKGLDSVIEKRRATGELFNEMDIWQWFIQLFDALTYCHFGPDEGAHIKILNGEKYKTDWNVVWHRGEWINCPSCSSAFF